MLEHYFRKPSTVGCRCQKEKRWHWPRSLTAWVEWRWRTLNRFHV